MPPESTRADVDGVSLTQGWRLSLTPAGACPNPAAARRLTDWTPAVVPGTAALALQMAGREAGDLNAQDNWYRAPLPEMGPAVLRFEGLATIADVFVGDRHVLRCESMFETHEVELDADTGGELWICFRALAPQLAAKGPRARWRPRMIEPQGLRLVRTSLLGHMPGWSPKVDIVGPWRPVRLIARDQPRPRDLRILANWDGEARLMVELSLAGCRTAPILSCGDASAPMTALGADRWRVDLTLPDAQPWRPHTHGTPALYPLAVEVDGVRIELGRTGFRRIELDRGPDGRGWGLRVNGEAVFCRGACWINPDILRLGGAREDYEPTLRLARDAGFNMIRVSGVGVYESRAFFELCDEFGLLVWQDFMFANFDYPSADEGFLAHVRREAEDLLSGTQGSPALAVLCGGSEVMQQATMLGLPRLEWPLFDEVLPQVAERLRPDAVYLPNTPFGGALPFAAADGVTHYYGVGAYERPLEDARRAEVRFASECLALANVPQPESLARGLQVPAVHDPRWKARVPRDRGASWDFEDTRDHYLARIFEVDPHRLRREDPQRYLDLSRAVSGEVMTAVFAEWRRARSPCAGGLVWTLRDLEIGAGWGLIDAAGEPKPAYYALKRLLQPVALAITDEGVNGLAAHLFNDGPEGLAGELRLSVHTEEASSVEAQASVVLPPRSAQEMSAFELLGRFADLSYAYRFGPRSHSAVSVELLVDGQAAAQAIWFAHSGAGLRPAAVEARVESGDGAWRLVLTSPRLLRYVHVAAPGYRSSDDGFPLLPGRPHTIELSPRDGRAAPPRGEIFTPGGELAGGFCHAPSALRTAS